MKQNVFKLGIDVGSTTLKIIVLDTNNSIVHKNYVRHKADINGTLAAELDNIEEQFSIGCRRTLFLNSKFSIQVTGSAGMGIAERCKFPFVQEVVASVEVVRRLYPQTGTLIDLGGEDAKMVFFNADRQPDIRMNGSCAGGTGAFIDQMADLMNITVSELGALALQGEKVYPVASRCGVFAKTDVQNLISRKVNSADIARSILHAVALQSVTSLARACTVRPPVVCIGGPLTFLPALRKAFVDVLQLSENELILPENSEYFPALGCALLV
jgi:predicted CoA-substrate-specific enzyme activase